MTDDPFPTPEQQEQLNRRATQLAREIVEERTGDEVMFAVLAVHPERFGVPINRIQELGERRTITRLPGLSELWEGLVNIRGSMYPVLNLRRYLNMPPPAGNAVYASKIVLLSANANVIGVLIDDIDGFQSVRTHDISQLHLHHPSVPDDALRGITADMLTVLDIDGMVSDARLFVGFTEEHS